MHFIFSYFSVLAYSFFLVADLVDDMAPEMQKEEETFAPQPEKSGPAVYEKLPDGTLVAVENTGLDLSVNLVENPFMIQPQPEMMIKRWIRKDFDEDGYFLLQLAEEKEHKLFLTAEDNINLTVQGM